eukprot:2214423-Rhodomonas_salina.1
MGRVPVGAARINAKSKTRDRFSPHVRRCCAVGEREKGAREREQSKRGQQKKEAEEEEGKESAG